MHLQNHINYHTGEKHHKYEHKEVIIAKDEHNKT